MTGERHVDWLVQEVNDLLDVSNVGLYEFMELLDMDGSGVPEAQRTEIARKALERLLAQPGVTMYRTRWATSDKAGSVSLADLPADPWRPPDGSGSYVALDRPG